MNLDRIFIACEQIVSGILDDNNNPIIAQFDWDTEQDEYPEGELQSDHSVLFSAGAFETNTLSQDYQHGVGEIELRLVSKKIRSGKEEVYNSNFITHWDVLRLIHKAMNGKDITLRELPGQSGLPEEEDEPVFNSAQRIGYVPDHRQSGYFRTTQIYRIHTIDTSAARTFLKVSANLNFQNIAFNG